MSTGGVISPRRRKRTSRGIIPYDTRLVARSRKLRKNETDAEAILWGILRRKGIGGYKFTRQKPIDKYILDFYCSKLLLGIEADGLIHNRKIKYDEKRTQKINYYDIKIIRFKNEEIIYDLGSVAEKILKEIEKRKSEINHPRPAQRQTE